MDPDEALRELRRLTEHALTEPKFDGYGGLTWRQMVTAMGEQFRALDDWLMAGGFPPSAWTGAGVGIPPEVAEG